jgi:hypothetical protein
VLDERRRKGGRNGGVGEKEGGRKEGMEKRRDGWRGKEGMKKGTPSFKNALHNGYTRNNGSVKYGRFVNNENTAALKKEAL